MLGTAFVPKDQLLEAQIQKLAEIQVLEQTLTESEIALMSERLGQERLLISKAEYLIRLGAATGSLKHWWNGTIAYAMQTFPVYAWVLALCGGLIYFYLLLKITGLMPPSRQILAIGIVGVVLGAASTVAVLTFLTWQEAVLGFKENGEMINDCIYYVLGVGVREEALKAIFFLPLVPFLYRSRNPQLTIFAAACIGLGFAAYENLGYSFRGFNSVGRFVTANFLHISLTGLLGFAICRFLYTPRKEWDRLLGTFVAVVLIHGVYDILAVGAIDGMQAETQGFFAIFVFVYTCHHFFNHLQKHCQLKRQTISPMAVFVIGCSLLYGLSLISASLTNTSLRSAIELTTPQIFGSIPIMFLYINRFRNE